MKHIMTTHNYKSALASAPVRYHRAQRGGDKIMTNYLERNNYDNNSLLACCKVVRNNSNNKQNKIIMATKNLLTSGLGVNVLNGVRNSMYNNFCESLCASLDSSASASCGVGRLTYAALIATWRKDTADCNYVLNESEGRKLFSADSTDSRVRRVGVDGHWSYFVAPSAKGGNKEDNKESDSISVLVGGWLRSWSSWYDSVVCFGHYGANGVPSASSITAGLLNRCSGLWSSRGVGGRTAASAEEKAQKKVAKAVAGLSSAELLAALRASGVDLSALVGSAPQTASANDSDNNE